MLLLFDLADKHVRVRRIGDGVLLDVAVGLVLEEGKQVGGDALNDGRHDNLLRDASGRFQDF